MRPREFRRFLDRDGGCYHCGTTDDTLIPQHRANRGHGGHKAGNQPSNIIVLCAHMNGLVESDAEVAEEARRCGWKLRRHEDPTMVPVFDAVNATWWFLDNDYARSHSA